MRTQIGPATMENFVWSWKRGEPNSAFSCTLLDADGRWRTVDCNESHRAACRVPDEANELTWQLSTASVGVLARRARYARGARRGRSADGDVPACASVPWLWRCRRRLQTTFANAACPGSSVFSVPVAGRQNTVLAAVASGEAVWVNHVV